MHEDIYKFHWLPFEDKWITKCWTLGWVGLQKKVNNFQFWNKCLKLPPAPFYITCPQRDCPICLCLSFLFYNLGIILASTLQGCQEDYELMQIKCLAHYIAQSKCSLIFVIFNIIIKVEEIYFLVTAGGYYPVFIIVQVCDYKIILKKLILNRLLMDYSRLEVKPLQGHNGSLLSPGWNW